MIASFMQTSHIFCIYHQTHHFYLLIGNRILYKRRIFIAICITCSSQALIIISDSIRECAQDSLSSLTSQSFSSRYADQSESTKWFSLRDDRRSTNVEDCTSLKSLEEFPFSQRQSLYRLLWMAQRFFFFQKKQEIAKNPTDRVKWNWIMIRLL